MDRQDRQNGTLRHGEITGRVIGCAFEVMAELGAGFLESVYEKVIVELKAVKAITPEHQAQIINYLNATGIEVGLLITFGNPKLEYKRFSRNFNPVHPC